MCLTVPSAPTTTTARARTPASGPSMSETPKSEPNEERNVDADETLTVGIDVRNSGARKGREVVQLYIADVESTPHKPPKELKAFTLSLIHI